MRSTTQAHTWPVFADGVLVGDVYRAPDGTYAGEPLSRPRALAGVVYESVAAAAWAVARAELRGKERS